MSLRFTRGALAILIASIGFVAIPACKKKKPPEPDTPNPTPNPQPNPQPNPNTRDPYAPQSPVFGTSDPRTAGMRLAAEGNLKQIITAIHNYEITNGSLPGGYADKSGKPGLSWRVALLPYLGADNLFKQFKLDEPWDSPTNKTLITKMPASFAPPKQDTNGWTFYRGFSGPGTWLPPQQQLQPGQPIRGVKLLNISDGTSNTILVAEAYEPVIWTKPEELEFAPNNVPKLGGVFASGINVGMADGSVKFLRTGIDQKKLAEAIQINDGTVSNLDD